MKKHIVIIEEVVIHRIEVEAKNAEEAEVIGEQAFNDGLLVDADPYQSQRVIEVETAEIYDGSSHVESALLYEAENGDLIAQVFKANYCGRVTYLARLMHEEASCMLRCAEFSTLAQAEAAADQYCFGG